MPPKKKRMTKKTKFLAEHRTAMITDFEKNDHADVDAVVKLSTGLHLQRCKSRKKFVAVLCSGQAKEDLDKCVKFVVNMIVELYKLLYYMKGKRFMQLEQAWMKHIHSYFSWPTEVNSTLDSYVVWQAVVGKCECSVSDEDQRIVVSTMCMISK